MLNTRISDLAPEGAEEFRVPAATSKQSWPQPMTDWHILFAVALYTGVVPLHKHPGHSAM
jgi:hypothetical protein